MEMSTRFGRGLWVVTAAAISLTICLEIIFGPAAIDAGEWTAIGLIGVLGFLVWSVGLGMLLLVYGH
jgi:hypothetical protein